MSRNIHKTFKALAPLLMVISILTSLFFISCTAFDKDKQYVIGILNPNPALKALIDGFKGEMTRYGYAEGKNITYTEENKAGDFDSALQSFKEKNVDIIITATTPSTRQAQKAVQGTGIPVIGTSFDPVRGGIVKSLIHKKDNITGIKLGGSVQKALEWLLAISPDIKRIFVPIKFDTRAAALSLEDLKEAAGKFNVSLHVSEVNTLRELQDALASMPGDSDAVFILHSIFIVSNINIIMETAVKQKLPSGASAGQYALGTTISYGMNPKRSGEQAGRLAHRILQGASASSLPFETADYFLGINLKTAEAIGLDIPFKIRDQADYVLPPDPGSTDIKKTVHFTIFNNVGDIKG